MAVIGMMDVTSQLVNYYLLAFCIIIVMRKVFLDCKDGAFRYLANEERRVLVRWEKRRLIVYVLLVDRMGTIFHRNRRTINIYNDLFMLE